MWSSPSLSCSTLTLPCSAFAPVKLSATAIHISCTASGGDVSTTMIQSSAGQIGHGFSEGVNQSESHVFHLIGGRGDCNCLARAALMHHIEYKDNG